jgi:hypothetical protein
VPIPEAATITIGPRQLTLRGLRAEHVRKYGVFDDINTLNIPWVGFPPKRQFEAMVLLVKCSVDDQCPPAEFDELFNSMGAIEGLRAVVAAVNTVLDLSGFETEKAGAKGEEKSPVAAAQ